MDRSDFLLLVKPGSNTSRLCIGARGNISSASLPCCQRKSGVKLELLSHWEKSSIYLLGSLGAALSKKECWQNALLIGAWQDGCARFLNWNEGCIVKFLLLMNDHIYQSLKMPRHKSVIFYLFMVDSNETNNFQIFAFRFLLAYRWRRDYICCFPEARHPIK